MADVEKIIAPMSNVNDSSVVVCEHCIEDYGKVEEGQAVIIIETSKATTELTAPVNGIIHYMTDVDEEVANGTLLAVIGKTRDDIDSFLREESSGGTPPAHKTADVIFDRKDRYAYERRGGSEKKDNDTEFGIYDSAVTLGEIMVRNSEYSDKDKLLARIRTSEGVRDMTAPASGYVYWYRKPYETIAANQPAGFISQDKNRGINYRTYKDDATDDGRQDRISYTSLRLSAAAAKLLDEKGTTAEALGLTGLVTADDVCRAIEPSTSSGKKTQMLPVEHSVPGKYVKPSKAKRTEVQYLGEANKNAVLSRVSVLVPTRGIFSACAMDHELAGRFSSVIIMEVSRLLMKYPLLRSVYEDGSIYEYDKINVGYALSIDDGLKVPVFKDSNKLSLDEVIELKEGFIEKYITKTLSPEDLSGGTFTISDMSGSGCYMFDPVLNLGQSAILGVGGENPSHTNYPLILAFDHRVCDGMMAAEFLNELRQRLAGHENVLLPAPCEEEYDGQRDVYCNYCFRDAKELEEKGHYLFKAVDKTGQEKYICSICAAGY